MIPIFQPCLSWKFSVNYLSLACIERISSRSLLNPFTAKHCRGRRGPAAAVSGIALKLEQTAEGCFTIANIRFSPGRDTANSPVRIGDTILEVDGTQVIEDRGAQLSLRTCSTSVLF